MRGFSATIDAPTKRPLPLVPQCGQCQLHKTCISPKMKVWGNGKKKIMVCGEAPGKNEDEQNRPFIGDAGDLLRRTLAKAGIDLDEDCYTINAARCRPPDNKLPPKSIEFCRPFQVKDIEELRPRVLLLLGGSAVKSIVGWLWKEDVGAAGRWDGWQIPSQKLNAWVCCTLHPSYINRLDGQGDGDLARMFFERHVAAAVALHGSRPWKERPDWHKQVTKLLDPDEAAMMIRAYCITEKPIVFDYETTTRKPDSSNAEIYCCSVSDGSNALAFPWHGKAIDATRELLTSDTPKWGWNAQFEQRATRRHLGIDVRNWQWCGMLASHVLDNRDSICSLAFQSFARLGFADFKDDTTQYLKTKGSNERNRIREAPLDAILTRCGLDALVEWKLCELQQKEFDR